MKNTKQLSKREEKKILKRLDQIHKRSEDLFKEDKILLRELKREINAQQRKAG